MNSAEFTYTNLTFEGLKIKGIPVDLNAVTEINIFENLLSPVITGTIEFKDWQGLMELGYVIAGDDLDIVWGSPEKVTITNKFKVTALEATSEFDMTTYNVFRLHFTSPWAVKAFASQYTKAYKDKYIHEIIQDIVEACGATIEYIEPTKQKLEHYCLPLWTPARSIQTLLRMAMNEQKRGGYLLWTNLETGKVWCTTVEYMLNKTVGYYEKFFMRSGNLRYEGRVFNITAEQNFDLIRFLNMGMGKTEKTALYYDKDELFYTEENIKEYEHKHTAKKYPLPQSYLTEEWAIKTKTYIYPSKDAAVSDNVEFEDLVNGTLFADYTMFFSDVFKVNILTNGESSRRVGMMTRLDYPSINEAKKDFNLQYQGDYLIRSIRHIISGPDYYQAITLAGDGYFKHDGTLVEW